MSTNHHTPIVHGQSNSPDTINVPLGQLDAAISNEASVLDDRLDAIIIESGTSDAETIAARTAIEYKAGSPPATLGTALGYAGLEIHNVKAYGASPANTAAQNTTAINAAIAAAIDGVVVFPGTGDTYEVNEITIANNCHIIGNGNLLLSADDVILAVTADIDWLTIDGFSFDWDVAKNTESSHEAFTNGDHRGDLGGTSYSGVFEEIGVLLIQRCHFRGSRVYIWSNGTGTRATVQDCTWGVGVADVALDLWHNAALIISGHEPRVLRNYFNCYCPSGTNKDVIKLSTTASSRAQILHNYIKNGNSAAEAQLDFYDGGNRALVDGNTFINVQIMRKSVGTPANSIEIWFDKIINNHFEITAGYTYPDNFIFFNGALCIISGNTFRGDGSANQSCVFWNQLESGTDHDLGTPWPIAVIITNNMSYDVDKFLYSAVDDSELSGQSIISGNLIWNASYMIYVAGVGHDPTQTAVIGNYWMPDASPINQVAILAGAGTMALGNVVDQTLGSFVTPATFGKITATSIYTGSVAVNDESIGSFTPPDRGIVKVWTGSASTEAAMFAYRTTSSSHHCGLMCQESTIMAAAIVTGTPVIGTYTAAKITVIASTDGKIYFANRRGGARTIYYSVEAA